MYKVITLLIFILLISSCKFNLTGSLIKDPEVKKYTIKEENIMNNTNSTNRAQQSIIPKNIDAKKKDCNQTIKELKDQYIDLQIELGEIQSKKRKLAGEISYYQDSIYEQDKYHQKLAELEEAQEEYKEKKSELDDRVRAIKLLAEKCKIKVKLIKSGHD